MQQMECIGLDFGGHSLHYKQSYQPVIEVEFAMLTIWILVAAPFIGSFLGVIVTRYETSDSAFSGRSKCPDCQHQLAVRDLIPIVSWLIQGGKCRHCGIDISRIYLVSEAGAFVIALWAVVVVDEVFILPSCLLGWSLLTLSLIDIRIMRIPNAMSGLVLGAGLATSAIWFRPLFLDHIFGAMAGFAVLFVVRHAYYRLRGRQGLGNADERLLAAGGAWLGMAGVFSALFLSALLGVLAVCVARIFGRQVRGTDAIPFGPFLAAGIWLTWLYGPIFMSG